MQEIAKQLLEEEPRGEYVLALKLPLARDSNASLSELEIKSLLSELAALKADQKTLTRVAISHGMAKNAAYALALKMLGK